MELTPLRSTGPGLLQRQMNRLFDDFFGNGEWPVLGRVEWAPPLDVTENQDEIVVCAELPGVARDQIEISVTGNMLVLKGEKKEEHEKKKGNVHRYERSYGSFTRAITLPSSIDPNKVNAALKDGVLSIRIAKREDSKPRKIEVKVD